MSAKSNSSAARTLPDLWEAHVKTISVEQIADQLELEIQIQTFYKKIVSDGLEGSPLNDDETGIIASFLAPKPGTITVQEGDHFGFSHGLGMVAKINRMLVTHCLIAEIKQSLLDQVTSGAVASKSTLAFRTYRHEGSRIVFSEFARGWMAEGDGSGSGSQQNRCEPALLERLIAEFGDAGAPSTISTHPQGPIINWRFRTSAYITSLHTL